MTIKRSNIKKIMWVAVVCLFFPLTATGEKLTEDGSTETEQGIGFLIREVLPDNQIDKGLSYYYLDVKPGQKQKVTLEIINYLAKEQAFIVQVNNATTNSNGLINYNAAKIAPHASLKYPLDTVVKNSEQEVVVPAESTGTVTLDFEIPAEAFEGIILGGVQVRLKSADSEEKPGTDGGMSVANTYSYVKGIILTEDEQTPLKGTTGIELLDVEPLIENGSKLLNATFLNQYPEIYGDFQIKGTITKKDTSKVIVENKLTDALMAPNSLFDFQLNWGMLEIEAGDYLFTAIVNDGEQSQTFTKDFTISKKVAKKLNKETVFKIIIPQWWLNAVIGLSVISAILLILQITRQVTQNKMQPKEPRNENRKRKKTNHR